MPRLALLISAVPLLLGLGATVAFTNNDVTIRQRQSSARRRVLYADYLSFLDSSREVTPTGKWTEHRSKPSSDADHPSTEKLSTSRAPTDYLSSLSSGTTTSSTSGSWTATDYSSPLSSHQHKETAPKPVELKAALGETAKSPVARTDFSYLKEWNTGGNAGSYLDRLNSTPTPNSGSGIPSYANALSSTATSSPNSDPGVTIVADTLAGATPLSMPAGDVDPVARTDFSYSKEWNTGGNAGSYLDRLNSTPTSNSGAGIPSYTNALSATATSYPTPPKSEPPSTTDLQLQFGQILENQLEITKQVGMSISELKEMQDQQGRFIQTMAKNDFEMTQMMVSVRNDSSEMKSDMRQSQTQQASLAERLAALEAKVVDQGIQVRAPPEPTKSPPTPAATAIPQPFFATAIPQTSILDASASVSNTINSYQKSGASAQVTSAERNSWVPIKKKRDPWHEGR